MQYLQEIAGFPAEKLPFLSIPCYVPASSAAAERNDDDRSGGGGGGDGTVVEFPKPERGINRVMDYYLLDAASVLITEALSVQPNDAVLDLCAAPGGKSVAILQRLTGHSGTLDCNEYDERRRKRLQSVLQDYAPADVYGSRVTVTGFDGTVSHFFKKAHYDRVLVDAPCSSDRHLIHNSREMEQWSPLLSGQMAQRQFLLLMTALRAVKPGGLIVYGTCSLSEHENDAVVSKALTDSVRVCGIKCELAGTCEWNVSSIAEATTHGWIVLPDTSGGWGPLFFAILRRVPDEDDKDIHDSDDNDNKG